MLEGKLPNALPNGHDSEKESGLVTPMRALTWSDIRARLEAARDLRASMNGMEGQSESQPHASFASRIASTDNRKVPVNLSDLANGKGSHLKDGTSDDVAAPASRGNS